MTQLIGHVEGSRTDIEGAIRHLKGLAQSKNVSPVMHLMSIASDINIITVTSNEFLSPDDESVYLTGGLCKKREWRLWCQEE
jgi:hypothetical protein